MISLRAAIASRECVSNNVRWKEVVYGVFRDETTSDREWKQRQQLQDTRRVEAKSEAASVEGPRGAATDGDEREREMYNEFEEKNETQRERELEANDPPSATMDLLLHLDRRRGRRIGIGSRCRVRLDR